MQTQPLAQLDLRDLWGQFLFIELGDDTKELISALFEGAEKLAAHKGWALAYGCVIPHQGLSLLLLDGANDITGRLLVESRSVTPDTPVGLPLYSFEGNTLTRALTEADPAASELALRYEKLIDAACGPVSADLKDVRADERFDVQRHHLFPDDVMVLLHGPNHSKEFVWVRLTSKVSDAFLGTCCNKPSIAPLPRHAGLIVIAYEQDDGFVALHADVESHLENLDDKPVDLNYNLAFEALVLRAEKLLDAYDPADLIYYEGESCEVYELVARLFVAVLQPDASLSAATELLCTMLGESAQRPTSISLDRCTEVVKRLLDLRPHFEFDELASVEEARRLWPEFSQTQRAQSENE